MLSFRGAKNARNLPRSDARRTYRGILAVFAARDDTARRKMIIDISPPLDADIGLWPGDPRNTLHVGAHVDAPNHTLAGAGDITSWPLEIFVGRCNVIHVDIDRGERITPRHIEGKSIDAPRVLFRTNTFPDWHNWNDDFASLSLDLIAALKGVVLS